MDITKGKIETLLWRFLFVSSCVFFCMSLVCYPISAEENYCGDNVKWNISNGILTITGQGEMDNYTVDNYAPWYGLRENIVSIVIESGVTTIGEAAFYNCSNLKRVTIADTVEKISDFVFLECSLLENVQMGNGVKTIGDSSFMLCTSLKSISLIEGLEEIGYQAFMGCQSISSVTIPSTVLMIGESAFAYCDNLVQVVMNASLNKLPDWMFYGCNHLLTISLSESVIEIGDSAFHDCNQLQNVYIDTSDSVCKDLTQQIKEDVEGFNSVISSDYVEEGSIFVPSTDSMVSQNKKTDNSEINSSLSITSNTIDYSIDSVVKNEEGWQEVISEIDSYLDSPFDDQVEEIVYASVKVQSGFNIDKDYLNSFVGKNVILTIENNNIEYVIDFSNVTDNGFTSDLSLNYNLIKVDDHSKDLQAVVGDAESYFLKFKDSCNLRTKVKILIGIEHARNYATLYQKDGKSWDLIHSVQIDREGYASFYLAGFDRFTEYLIGLNVEGVNITNAYIPSELYADYGGLMDEHGNMYEVTGIQSKWGITLSQFSLIVFGVLGGVIVLVGLVMFIIFKMQQNKEKIRREVMNESKK